MPEAQRQPLVNVFDGLTNVIIQVIQGLMKWAPIAVFALLMSTGATLGLDVIGVLGRYVTTVLLGLGFLIFGLYPLAIRLMTGRSLSEFYRSIAPAQLLAFFLFLVISNYAGHTGMLSG